MICEEYSNLNAVEKVMFIGQLVHIVQSDSNLFNNALKIIEIGKIRGLLDDVKILPNEELTKSV